MASLHFCGVRSGADNIAVPRGTIALPIDPQLGSDDPNLRVLYAMQVAARTEIERQRSGASDAHVHVPQALDLSDLRRFPPSTSR